LLKNVKEWRNKIIQVPLQSNEAENDSTSGGIVFSGNIRTDPYTIVLDKERY
jgi:hypothetical protein